MTILIPLWSTPSTVHLPWLLVAFHCTYTLLKLYFHCTFTALLTFHCTSPMTHWLPWLYIFSLDHQAYYYLPPCFALTIIPSTVLLPLAVLRLDVHLHSTLGLPLQLYFHCTSTVLPLYIHCTSTVLTPYFHCTSYFHSALPTFHCTSTVLSLPSTVLLPSTVHFNINRETFRADVSGKFPFRGRPSRRSEEGSKYMLLMFYLVFYDEKRVLTTLLVYFYLI